MRPMRMSFWLIGQKGQHGAGSVSSWDLCWMAQVSCRQAPGRLTVGLGPAGSGCHPPDLPSQLSIGAPGQSGLRRRGVGGRAGAEPLWDCGLRGPPLMALEPANAVSASRDDARGSSGKQLVHQVLGCKRGQPLWETEHFTLGMPKCLYFGFSHSSSANSAVASLALEILQAAGH